MTIKGQDPPRSQFYLLIMRIKILLLTIAAVAVCSAGLCTTAGESGNERNDDNTIGTFNGSESSKQFLANKTAQVLSDGVDAALVLSSRAKKEVNLLIENPKAYAQDSVNLTKGYWASIKERHVGWYTNDENFQTREAILRSMMPQMNWAAYIYANLLLVVRSILLNVLVVIGVSFDILVPVIVGLTNPESTFSFVIILGTVLGSGVVSYKYRMTVVHSVEYVYLTVFKMAKATVKCTRKLLTGYFVEKKDFKSLEFEFDYTPESPQEVRALFGELETSKFCASFEEKVTSVPKVKKSGSGDEENCPAAKEKNILQRAKDTVSDRLQALREGAATNSARSVGWIALSGALLSLLM